MVEEEASRSTNLDQSQSISLGYRDASQEESEDMIFSIASVWVKVELDDNEDDKLEESEDVSQEVIPSTATNPKKKRKKSTATFQCELCSYTTKHKRGLKIHILGHSMQKPYTCPYCDYGTTFKPSFERHILKNHNEKSEEHIKCKTHKCDQCDYATDFKWNLKAHRRKHNEKSFKCKFCDFKTAYMHKYKSHVEMHIRQQSDQKFKCDKCPFETKFQGHIQRHLFKIHNNVLENAPKCDFCGFTTIRKWRLNIHKQRMKRENDLKCEFCDFKTNYMCHFKLHRQKHLNIKYGKKNERNIQVVSQSETNSEKQFIPQSNESVKQKDEFKFCPKCDFKTNNEEYLQLHFSEIHSNKLEVHTDRVQEFKCQFCNFTSELRTELDLHLNNNKLNNVITCQYCPFQSIYNCQMALHQSIHFGDVTRQYEYNNISLQLDTTKTNSNEFLNLNAENDNTKGDSNVKIKEQSLLDDYQINVNQDMRQDIMNESNGKTKLKKSNKNVKEKSDLNSIPVLVCDDKEKPFHCTMCNYASKFKASVQRHYQRKHTGSQDYPFKCSNCDFATKTKEQLYLHNKRSESNIEISCTKCEFKTLFKCQFAVHERTHYDFKCNLCNYLSRHQHKLNRHMSIYHLGNGLK